MPPSFRYSGFSVRSFPLIRLFMGTRPVASTGPGGGGLILMKSRPRLAKVQHTDFEALYDLHSREVWALAYARWLNADLALDIMQEAFLRLWKQWQEGAAILNPRAWLLRVARNLAEDHAKSAFRRNGTHPPQTMNGVRGHEPLPLDYLEREETFGQLREELEKLAPADREILTLRYGLDYHAGEIAAILN